MEIISGYKFENNKETESKKSKTNKLKEELKESKEVNVVPEQELTPITKKQIYNYSYIYKTIKKLKTVIKQEHFPLLIFLLMDSFILSLIDTEEEYLDKVELLLSSFKKLYSNPTLSNEDIIRELHN